MKMLFENILYRRITAFIIDLFTSALVAYISYHASWKELLPFSGIIALTGAIHLSMTTLFYIFSRKHTIGQKLFSINVVKVDGNALRVPFVHFRNLMFCVLFFGSFYSVAILVIFSLSLTKALIGDQNQTLWDFAFKAKVSSYT